MVRGGQPGLVDILRRWTFARAFLHRGWWLTASIYLVVDVGLGPGELVAIAVGQGAVSLLVEVPAGVVADTIGRRWSLVLSHLLMGTAMVATALVSEFALILATQMLWGVSWTFASGADIAWITDELDQPAQMPVVLVRAARSQLLGSAVGITALGAAAAVLDRATTMVLAGVVMIGLAGYVRARFREVRFVPARSRRWARSWTILRAAFGLAVRSPTLRLVFALTVLVHGALQFGRLYPLRLIEAGFPADPLFWFVGLSVLILLSGTLVLRLVEHQIGSDRGGRVLYAWGCATGAAGLVVFALAPDPVIAAVSIVLVAATAEPIARISSAIWVNQSVGSDARATMHSFLAQSEYAGVIGLGAAVAAVAAVGITQALLLCAVLFVAAGALSYRLR